MKDDSHLAESTIIVSEKFGKNIFFNLIWFLSRTYDWSAR